MPLSHQRRGDEIHLVQTSHFHSIDPSKLVYPCRFTTWPLCPCMWWSTLIVSPPHAGISHGRIDHIRAYNPHNLPLLISVTHTQLGLLHRYSPYIQRSLYILHPTHLRSSSLPDGHSATSSHFLMTPVLLFFIPNLIYTSHNTHTPGIAHCHHIQSPLNSHSHIPCFCSIQCSRHC